MPIIVDDLVVFGTNQEEHDKQIRKLFERCQTMGIKLSPAKFEKGLHAITSWNTGSQAKALR